jgi:hypothetical protein
VQGVDHVGEGDQAFAGGDDGVVGGEMNVHSCRVFLPITVARAVRIWKRVEA